MTTQPTTAADLNQQKAIKDGLLIFAGKVLIVTDTVNYIYYPIRNISSVRVIKKINTITKEMPNWPWIFLVIGIVTIPLGINILPIPIALFLSSMRDYIINRVKVMEEHGISLEMNSGSLELFSVNEDFMEQVRSKLYEILNQEESQPVVIDLDHNVINYNPTQVQQFLKSIHQNGNFGVGVNNGQIHTNQLGGTIIN
jgi:hypothetical protein